MTTKKGNKRRFTAGLGLRSESTWMGNGVGAGVGVSGAGVSGAGVLGALVSERDSISMELSGLACRLSSD
jgi:hypothetical protein